MRKKAAKLAEWASLRRRNWRDVLKALLDTSAPNNPAPRPKDEQRSPDRRPRGEDKKMRLAMGHLSPYNGE